MLSTNVNLSSISHPLVASLHMKKDFSFGDHAEDVLVIETIFSEDEVSHELFDTYLVDLLIDLEDLKKKAEKCVGSFDRVDIRTA